MDSSAQKYEHSDSAKTTLKWYEIQSIQISHNLPRRREVDDVGPGLRGRLLWRDFESYLEVFRQIYLGMRQTLHQQSGHLSADEERSAVNIRR